ncbi:MAG TPA: RDD family protein [Sporichthyaceae bacterium]|nr:RDD family protein [Sporichthyaceae bacterium]
MDRRMLGSWLSGPRSFAEATGTSLGYPGERLGLPLEGRNSVAGFGRRLAATTIDWIIASMIAKGLAQHPSAVQQVFLTPAVFAVLNVALVATIGAGFGGRLLGIRVARVDGSNPPLVSVIQRTFLMCLAVPALIWDRDGRGVHDRFARCVVVQR